MKHILLPLNIVLLLAVVFLFYRSYNGTAKTNGAVKKNDTILPFNNRIAYFSIDSLESKFEYYKEKKDELEKMQIDGNNSLESAQKELSSRASQLTQQFQQNPTPELKAKAENEIGQLQEGLQKKKQDMESKLYSEGKKMNEDVQKKIRDYLATYNKSKGFSYILTDDPGMVYYKDSLLNITGDLIEGLNGLYKKTKQ